MEELGKDDAKYESIDNYNVPVINVCCRDCELALMGLGVHTQLISIYHSQENVLEIQYIISNVSQDIVLRAMSPI